MRVRVYSITTLIEISIPFNVICVIMMHVKYKDIFLNYCGCCIRCMVLIRGDLTIDEQNITIQLGTRKKEPPAKNVVVTEMTFKTETCASDSSNVINVSNDSKEFMDGTVTRNSHPDNSTNKSLEPPGTVQLQSNHLSPPTPMDDEEKEEEMEVVYASSNDDQQNEVIVVPVVSDDEDCDDNIMQAIMDEEDERIKMEEDERILEEEVKAIQLEIAKQEKEILSRNLHQYQNSTAL